MLCMKHCFYFFQQQKHKLLQFLHNYIQNHVFLPFASQFYDKNCFFWGFFCFFFFCFFFLNGSFQWFLNGSCRQLSNLKRKNWFGSVVHLFFYIYQRINMVNITLLIDTIRFRLATLRIT